jgi:ATP-dependent Lon protease
MLSPYGSDPLEGYVGPTVRLFNKADAIIAVNNAQLCDPESATRISKVIKNLASHGEFRKLAQLSDDFHYGLRRLQEKYEQFREVIEYILSCAALARHRGDGVLRMSPVLLIGDPGVGKTEFVVEFSELLDVGFKKIDLGASQSNAELAGSSAFWTNSAPSKIFLMASQGLYGECHGNPLFLLDEIDKPAGSAGFTNGDPLGVLHTLLERHSSKTFVDLAIDIPIDVSNFTYFATCNDPDLIPRSLRTRFREFTICISQTQMKNIACSIAEAMLKDLPRKNIAFDESTINALSQLDSPRLIRTYAQDALGRALVGGRDVIHPKDLRIEVRSKIKMGFL